MPTFFYYLFAFYKHMFIYNQKKILLFPFCKLLESIHSIWKLLLHFSIRLKAKLFSQAHNDQALSFSNGFQTSIPSTYSSHLELLAVVLLYIALLYILFPLCRIQRCNNHLESVLIMNLPPTNSCGESLI